MKNPFISIKDGMEYVAQNCSLNNVVIKKLPIYGIDDTVIGKKASDFFSTKQLIHDIKENASKLNIDTNLKSDRQLPQELINILTDTSANENVKKFALNIVKSFGYRLGIILCVLKTGYKENKEARKDWTEENWEYWKNIKNIIMVGGLAGGVFGKLIKRYVLEIFEMAGIEPYNLIIFDNATHVGIMGCATIIKQQTGTNIVMDWGQTNIKRSIIKRENGEIIEIDTLQSLHSKYMSAQTSDMEKNILEAKELHKYLIKVITDTYQLAEKKNEIGNEIIISVGNYVMGGCLNSLRGGYAKLSLIFSNYAECLSEELSGILRKNIKITLVHDGTAVALYFKEFKDSVCITMGTGLGVGFPEINIQ